jgi:hypothetical protein
MSERDDMLIGTNFGGPPQAAAVSRAREERHAAGMRKGLLRRMIQTGMHRRAAAGAARLALGEKAVGFARGTANAASLARMGPGAMARGAARLVSPVGLLLGALAVAAVVTLRLASGQPLEGTGEQLNQLFLGDLDEESRAKTATRGQMAGDQDLARVVGQQGKVNSQIHSVAADLQRMNKEREVGATLMRREFPVNNMLDMLILRGRDAFLAAWRGSGGADATDKFRTNYGELINGPAGSGAR